MADLERLLSSRSLSRAPHIGLRIGLSGCDHNDDDEGTQAVAIKVMSSDLRKRGGAKGIRTPDLLDANESRYQLRHSP